MNKVLNITLAGLTAQSLVGVEAAQKQPTLPNILFIIVDDQGYGDLSCYPHLREVYTPHLDALAASGVKFTNGYVTHHGSAPSRAAILSGRYQQRLGFYDIWEVQKGIEASEKLLPAYLKDNGYSTGLVGKWHQGERDYNSPHAKGFDYFFGILGGMHDYYHPFKGDTWAGGALGRAYIYNQQDTVKAIEYMTDELSNRAIDFIEKNMHQPFYLQLAYTAPHSPFQAPKELIELFDKKEGKYRIIRAMTKSLDDNIGRIVQFLKDNNLRENTLIVYISDNGGTKEHHNWKLRGAKGMLSEGGIRVPFIMSLPGTIPQNLIYDEPVISLDLFPTMLNLAGIPYPNDKTLDGKNLLPFLRQEKKYSPHERLYWSWDPFFNQWAVREGDWKAIREKIDGEMVVGLFNLKEDVGETNNLIDVYPEKFESLKIAYQRWMSTMPPSIVGEDEWTPNGNGWKYIYETAKEKKNK